jgi:hypothetical protein
MDDRFKEAISQNKNISFMATKQFEKNGKEKLEGRNAINSRK